MKLSELKPCAACHGALPPIWYVVRMSMAMLDRRNTSAVLGLNTIFSAGRESMAAFRLAEAMAPGADDAVIVAMDKERELMTEFHVCQKCWLEKDVDLAMLSEAVRT